MPHCRDVGAQCGSLGTVHTQAPLNAGQRQGGVYIAHTLHGTHLCFHAAQRGFDHGPLPAGELDLQVFAGRRPLRQRLHVDLNAGEMRGALTHLLKQFSTGHRAVLLFVELQEHATDQIVRCAATTAATTTHTHHRPSVHEFDAGHLQCLALNIEHKVATLVSR